MSIDSTAARSGWRHPGRGIHSLAVIVPGWRRAARIPCTAALWGVWAHGTAGARLAKRVNRVGFLARELLAELPSRICLADGRAAFRAYLGAMLQTIKRHPLASAPAIVVGLPADRFPPLDDDRAALHLLVGRARRVPAEGLEARVALQNVGRRPAAHGDRRARAPEKFNFSVRSDSVADGVERSRRKAGRAHLRTAQGTSRLVLRRHGVFRDRSARPSGVREWRRHSTRRGDSLPRGGID